MIDEADSILIDEARIPLVIAGGDSGRWRAGRTPPIAWCATSSRTCTYTVDVGAHNIALTDAGIRARRERVRLRQSVRGAQSARCYTAVQDALHAHALLRRDVDYLVKNGAIEMVDEFKGRIAQDRRWPAGLHTAIEAKEGVAAEAQGCILGSITLQNLVALYPQVCGMTGHRRHAGGRVPHGVRPGRWR